jgi:hypothetical protein
MDGEEPLRIDAADAVRVVVKFLSLPQLSLAVDLSWQVQRLKQEVCNLLRVKHWLWSFFLLFFIFYVGWVANVHFLFVFNVLKESNVTRCVHLRVVLHFGCLL